MNDFDKLSPILRQFDLKADVFFSGNLCELSEFEELSGDKGHLHILRNGRLQLISNTKESEIISEPSLLFFPQGRQHRIIPDEDTGADLVCATIQYNGVQAHPIALSLPSFIRFKLTESKHARLASSAQWLFEEAFTEQNGKTLMVNKLVDIFIIQVLRVMIDYSSIKQGMFAGLSHPYLSRAITAIHENPDYPWTVESLANKASMSRAKFASLFHRVVGQTPLDYMSYWRIHVAQSLLAKNMSINVVANRVGYENGSALTRMFKKKLGITPTQWLKNITP